MISTTDNGYRILIDFYESKELVEQMNKYMLENSIYVVYVSERLFDVLNTYYYVQGKYEYILDLNRKYLSYGFSRLKNSEDDNITFLYNE